jgi:hypothetical protein
MDDVDVGDVVDGKDGVMGSRNASGLQHSVGLGGAAGSGAILPFTTIPRSVFIVMGPLLHGFEKGASVRYG